MASNKEITATEKLLKLIRVEDSSDLKQQESPFITEDTAVDPEHEILESAELQLDSADTEPSAHQIDSSSSATPLKPTKEASGHISQIPSSLSTAQQINTENPTVGHQSVIPESNWTWYNTKKNDRNSLSVATNLFSQTKIGIDIQPGSLHLIKTNITKSKRTLLACESASFDYEYNEDQSPNIIDNPLLKGILSQKLASFCKGGLRKPEIWCSYAFCNPIEIYNITLPKVPAKDVHKAVFWSLKKDIDFDEKLMIFDYKIFKEIEIKGHIKLQAIVMLIPKKEVRSIENIFKDLGYPLAGLTFPAAAIQNFLQVNHSAHDSKPFVFFNIRDQNSFIDLFYQGKMLFSRKIKTGADSFVESLQEYATSHDIILDEKSAKHYIFNLFGRKNTYNKPEIDEEIRNSLELHSLPVVKRLIRQLFRTFEYCTTNFKIPPIEKIYTAGTNVLNDEILDNLGKRLGVPCSVIMPFSNEVFNYDSPPKINPNFNILPATGLALSDRRTTTNFLHTYAEQALEKTSEKINNIVAYVTIGLALVLGVFSAIQHDNVKDKRTLLNDLENGLNLKYTHNPRTRTSEYLQGAITKRKQTQGLRAKSIQRFQSIGIISEITQSLPEEVKLTNLSLKFPQTSSPQQKGQSSTNSDYKLVFLTGRILAPKSRQEFILLNTLKQLSTLEFASNPVLESSKQDISEESTGLTFTIKMELQSLFKVKV